VNEWLADFILTNTIVFYCIGKLKTENLAVFNLEDFHNSPTCQNKFHTKFSSYTVLWVKIISKCQNGPAEQWTVYNLTSFAIRWNVVSDLTQTLTSLYINIVTPDTIRMTVKNFDIPYDFPPNK